MVQKIHDAGLPAGRQGFTLIELLISIGITMLLVGGVVANYNSFNDTQVLKQFGLTLKSNLRLALVKATAVDKPTTGCTQLVGYQVTFAASSYATQEQCAPEGLGTAETVLAPAGVSFSPVPASITFEALTGRAIGGTTTYITILGRSARYFLQISPNGNVFDLGLQ